MVFEQFIGRLYRTFTSDWHHTGMTSSSDLRNLGSPPASSRIIKQKHSLSLAGKAPLAAILLAICCLLPQTGLTQASDANAPASSLPLLGDGSDMSSNAERRLGDRIARELYRDPDYIDDPVLCDYVQGIWQPLLAAARLRGNLSEELDERFAWQVLLGRDRTVNAFALPGGYLGLNLGLLAVVSNRDELASVLGHELSHVTQRHISRLMSKSSQQAPWMIGAMILGALAASKSPDAGSALIVGGQALATQNQLNFSRDMEREADRLGFGVMTQAGFEAQGFVTMFDKLQQASRHNDIGAYPYLRSHPLTTERIADMHLRQPLTTQHGSAQIGAPQPGVVHAMMVARAKILANAHVDALHSWQAQLNKPAFLAQPVAAQAGALYGASMAASRLRDAAQAQRLAQQLQALVAPDSAAQLQARWLGIELALAAGNITQADKLLQLVLANQATAPQRPSVLLQAQTALQADNPVALAQSAQQLQSWVAQQPRDALAWQALSNVYMAQKQSLRALRAQAEVRVAQLDYAGALDRLRAAQESVTVAGDASASHIDRSIIDTRRRQVEALFKEQALDH